MKDYSDIDEYTRNYSNVFKLGVPGESISTAPAFFWGQKCILMDPKDCDQEQLVRMYESYPWTKPKPNEPLRLQCDWEYIPDNLPFFTIFPDDGVNTDLQTHGNRSGGLEYLYVEIDEFKNTIKVISAYHFQT